MTVHILLPTGMTGCGVVKDNANTATTNWQQVDCLQCAIDSADENEDDDVPLPMTIRRLMRQHAARCKRWHHDPEEGKQKLFELVTEWLTKKWLPLTKDSSVLAEITELVRRYTPWTSLEWCGAAAGELGEAANIAKKIKRHITGLINKDTRDADPSLEKYRAQFGKELADTIHYCVLAALDANVDLETALRETFNAKSEEAGFPERL